MEKLRAELQKIRADAAPPPAVVATVTAARTPAPLTSTGKPAQVAIAAPQPTPANNLVAIDPGSFDTDWAQRVALIEKSSGPLTFAKAMAMLLDINAAPDLTLLLKLEEETKTRKFNSAYAMGSDSRGNIIWGSTWGWTRLAFAIETAIELCVKASGDSCKVVMRSSELSKKEFVEMAKLLGRQGIATVRDNYLEGLRGNVAPVVVQMNPVGPPLYGMASIRQPH
jgi:hypothetical protein